MLRRLLAASLLCLMATQANAATCSIREYNTIGQAQGQPAQIALEPAIADQVTTDFSGGAVQSGFFNAATSYVRLWCDTEGSFLVGTNPTAAATNAPIAAKNPEFFGVPVGGLYRLSVHAHP
jgi:hypothetical protein